MAAYWGIIDSNGNVFGVRLPDLPGAYGGGATPEEAIQSAAEAARIAVDDLTAKGLPLPRPRRLDAVMREVEEGEQTVLIQIGPPA